MLFSQVKINDFNTENQNSLKKLSSRGWTVVVLSMQKGQVCNLDDKLSSFCFSNQNFVQT